MGCNSSKAHPLETEDKKPKAEEKHKDERKVEAMVGQSGQGVYSTSNGNQGGQVTNQNTSNNRDRINQDGGSAGINIKGVTLRPDKTAKPDPESAQGSHISDHHRQTQPPPPPVDKYRPNAAALKPLDTLNSIQSSTSSDNGNSTKVNNVAANLHVNRSASGGSSAPLINDTPRSSSNKPNEVPRIEVRSDFNMVTDGYDVGREIVVDTEKQTGLTVEKEVDKQIRPQPSNRSSNNLRAAVQNPMGSSTDTLSPISSTPKGVKVLGRIETTLSLIKSSLSGLPVPGVEGVVGAFLQSVEIVKTLKANARAFEDFLNYLTKFYEDVIKPVFDASLLGEIPQSLMKDILDLSSDINALLEVGCEAASKDAVRRFTDHHNDGVFITNLNNAFALALQRFHANGTIALRLEVYESHRWNLSKGQQDLLDALPRAQAQYDSAARAGSPNCFEGTRSALLGEIRTWSENTDPRTPGIFWLLGLAGMGKSTMAQTVADELKAHSRLGASFFFSRDDATRRNPLLVFSTIAYQLAYFHPTFKFLIAKSLENNPDAGCSRPETQIKTLIVDPLRGISRPHLPVVVIVLDAFDECSDVEMMMDALTHLAGELHKIPFCLRFFITSRQDHEVVSRLTQAASPILSSISHIFRLDDIDKSIVKRDIANYLQYHLQQIAKKEDISGSWPTDEQLKALAARAGELFIFAATTIKFISKGGDPQSRLAAVLGDSAADGPGPYQGIDRLYKRILNESIPRKEPQLCQRFRLVVGALVVLQEPLPLDTLAKLIRLKDNEVQALLRKLHAIIILPPKSKGKSAIRFLHPSFLEFITNKKRCSDETHFIPESRQHAQLVTSCLTHMTNLLPRSGNDHQVKADGTGSIAESAFPPHLRYACLYWTGHLGHVVTKDEAISELVARFCKAKLPLWYQAMVTIGGLDSVNDALDQVEQYLTRANSRDLNTVLDYIRQCRQDVRDQLANDGGHTGLLTPATQTFRWS